MTAPGNTWNLRSKSSPAPAKAGACKGPLNLQNRNPAGRDCTEAAHAQLCHATGILQLPNDATPLRNRPVVMKVAVKNDPRRSLISEIKGYKAKAATNAGFPGAARNSASRDGRTGHARAKVGQRWSTWSFAPTSKLATATLDASPQ